MSGPRISIVTPSFNQGSYLEATIESINAQGYPALEHLIIDGGSTDESVRIIEKHASRLAYWVSERDRGQSHAINKGMARATGDIVGFVNSDDLLEPGALARIAGLARAGARWIAGSVRCFGEGREDEVLRVRRFDDAGPHARAEWLGRSVVWQQGCFWARSLADEVGAFREDLNFVFDWEYWLRLRLRADSGRGVRPVVIDDVLGAFRLHGDSKTMSRAERFLPELARVRADYRALLSPDEARESRRLERACTADFYQSRSVRMAAAGRRGEALRDVARSLAVSPSLALSRRTLGAIRMIARRGRAGGSGPA